MGFYSFSLLLLLFLDGTTHGLYIREASPKDQTTQCSASTETETLFWHTDADPTIKNDVALDIPVTITRTCRKRSLVKRQRQPKGKNVFNAICQRELTGRRLTRRTVDLEIRINDSHETRVPTPDGGEIIVFADQTWQYYNVPEDLDQREELNVMVVNDSRCRVLVEWLTRLRVWPDHGFAMGQEFTAGEQLEPRALEPTQPSEWSRAHPNQCDIVGLMPIHHAVSIAVRLIIEAFVSH